MLSKRCFDITKGWTTKKSSLVWQICWPSPQASIARVPDSENYFWAWWKKLHQVFQAKFTFCLLDLSILIQPSSRKQSSWSWRKKSSSNKKNLFKFSFVLSYFSIPKYNLYFLLGTFAFRFSNINLADMNHMTVRYQERNLKWKMTLNLVVNYSISHSQNLR